MKWTLVVAAIALIVIAEISQGPASAQNPYVPQRPVVPPPSAMPQLSPQPQPQGQGPLLYDFRPGMSNAQYGRCLWLEKNWKTLWERYESGYRQAQSLNPQDPRYAEIGRDLANLKQQLDAAWQTLTDECIYFHDRR
ncbi:MAG: hypothetical protein HY914_11275 [Desulfomonile tiedjei]|nr:hypothetical protein [Desulfomonile tiedjei]